jgi:DNA-binding Lrp family transcriptional regulator
MEKDRIEMSQRERDVLKVMSLVLSGKRTQGEAARLLGRSERQVRRIQRRLEKLGDAGVVHRLRGRASNNALDPVVAREAVSLYRRHYPGFGPTLASEKLAEEHQVLVSVETLRGLLLGAGLWQRQRHRDKHRQRRERRACFGEMVQADASEHDWLEGRGPILTLVGMIDDATGRIVCRFFASETTEAYMEVLGRWVGRHGRPGSWYSDRHGIFRAEEKIAGYDQKRSVPTQFSRALSELGIELILAGSPQAKGRVERLWGTAQDRLVKELRLAGARTMEQANGVLDLKFLPWFNRRCVVKAASGNDAHRPLGKRQDLAAILSIQQVRHVANDYTIRFENQVYQLLPPAHAGQRGGKVVVEQRADGTMKVRFKGRYLEHRRVVEVARKVKEEDGKVLGAPPPSPRSLAPGPIPAGAGPLKGRADVSTRPAVHRPAGRSGRTPAEPCPSGGGSCGSGNQAWRPAPTHPWR